MIDYQNIKNIIFSKDLNLNEKYILKNFENNKEVNIKFQKDLNFKKMNLIQIKLFLQNFTSKYLEINIQNSHEEKYFGISIFSKYTISRDIFTLTFSDEYQKLLSNLNIHQIQLLREIYSFNEKKSVELFKRFEGNSAIILSVEEIRIILDSEYIYERLFDFEKKILYPIIADIESNSDIKISYEKIKKIKNNPKSKVIAFKFYIIDILEDKYYDLIKKIRSEFLNRNIEYEKYYKQLRSYIKIKGHDYFNINFNLVCILEGGFINNLFTSLDENWSINRNLIPLETPIFNFERTIISQQSSVSSYIYEITSHLSKTFPEENFKKLPLFFISYLNTLHKDKILEFYTINYKVIIKEFNKNELGVQVFNLKI